MKAFHAWKFFQERQFSWRSSLSFCLPSHPLPLHNAFFTQSPFFTQTHPFLLVRRMLSKCCSHTHRLQSASPWSDKTAFEVPFSSLWKPSRWFTYCLPLSLTHSVMKSLCPLGKRKGKAVKHKRLQHMQYKAALRWAQRNIGQIKSASRGTFFHKPLSQGKRTVLLVNLVL